MVVVAAGYFQANGMPKKAISLTVLRQVVLLIPALLFLPRLLEHMPSFWGIDLNGLDGVWLAVPISDFGGFLLAVWFLRREFRRLYCKREENAL